MHRSLPTLALALALFGGTGCSSGGSESPTDENGPRPATTTDADRCTSTGDCTGTVEIEWWHAFAGSLEERLQAQVARYNASQDDFRVVARATGNYAETLDAGLAAFERGEHPTLLQVYEVGTATIAAERGVTVPIREVMERSGRTFDPSIYFPTIAAFYSTPEGELLSLPYNSSTPVLFANLDALAEAGLDENALPETWIELEALLRTLGDRGHDCPMTTSWPSWIHLENLSAWHDVPFATEENGFTGTGAELVFDTPFHVDHVARLDRWADEGLFVFSGRRNEGGVPFRAGDCVLLTESSGSYAGTRSAADFDFAISPLPRYDVAGAPQNTIIGGASLWVMAGRSDAEYRAAADLIAFLSSAEEQARWHEETGYLPITPAAYELARADGYYEREPRAAIPVEQMLGRTPTPRTRGVRLGDFVAVRDIIDGELERVWTSGRVPADALGDAVARGNELLRAFERRTAPP